MSIIFHEQATEMSKILTRYGIRRLYHFTAIDNLPTIAKCGGLWSKQRLERAGLFAGEVITGGNRLSLNLDRELGNWDKVHLYFCPNTPMARTVQQNPEGRDPQSAHICYLLIDPVVAMWKGACFTDTNATGKRDKHKRKQGLDGLKLIDFSTIRAHLSKRWVEPKQRWHRNVQAECLVPSEIPLEYIKSVSFISEASLKEGERLWASVDHPPFNINEELFHRGFPVVESFILTSEAVTKENLNTQQFRNRISFSTWESTRVTLLVNLQATAGTQAKVTWYDSDGEVVLESETEFEKESGYWHWPGLEIVELGEGDYSVEYYLSEIRWFKAYFEVRRHDYEFAK